MMPHPHIGGGVNFRLPLTNLTAYSELTFDPSVLVVTEHLKSLCLNKFKEEIKQNK